MSHYDITLTDGYVWMSYPEQEVADINEATELALELARTYMKGDPDNIQDWSKWHVQIARSVSEDKPSKPALVIFFADIPKSRSE